MTPPATSQQVPGWEYYLRPTLDATSGPRATDGTEAIAPEPLKPVITYNGISSRLRKYHAPNTPPNFPNTWEWFTSGLQRQVIGTVVALFATYTALIVSLWFALAGAFLGALVALGLITGTDVTNTVLHTGVATSVVAIAVPLTAITSGAGAFVYFYTSTLATNPLGILIGLAVGLLVAVLIVAVIAVFEGNLLRARGCRPLTVEEARRVSPLLQQLGVVLGWTNAPRFAIQETHNAGAWTYMRHVVLTKGLLATLHDDELMAVIAHELHHWRSGDSVGQHLVWASAWPIVLVYNIAYRISNPKGGGNGGQTKMLSFANLLAWIVAWPAALLIRFPMMLALRRDMRRQEYEADVAVKEAGYGPALVRALEVLSVREVGRTGWESALYSTHPTTDERIDRLRIPLEDDADYVSPPLGSETRSLSKVLGWIGLAFVTLIACVAIIQTQRPSNASSAPTSKTVANNGLAGTTPTTTYASSSVTTLPMSKASLGSAEHTAATFTDAIMDNMFNQSSYARIIAHYVPTSKEQSLLDSTESYEVTALDVGTSRVATNSATVLACYLDDGASRTNVDIAEFIRWRSGLANNISTQWFRDNVPLTLIGKRWIPGNVPVNLPGVPGTVGSDPTANQDSTIPPGFVPC